MRSFVKIIGLIIITGFGLSACGTESPNLTRNTTDISPLSTPDRSGKDIDISPEDDATPRQVIRLGLLVPLSGPDAEVGRALLNAATLALFDSQDKRLTLLPHDTRGTADGAATAMTQLLQQEPDLIIGPLFSHSIEAIRPMAKEAGINVIGFSSDHTVAGDGVYLLSFRMEEQIKRVIHYASDQGYARFAALVPETNYGTRALEIFGASVTEAARELVAVEFYPADSTQLVGPVKNIAKYEERRKRYTREIDFLNKLDEDDDFALEILEELKNKETIGDVEFEAILLPEGGSMLTTLAAWVSYYEIDPAKIKILGTGLWDDDMLFHEPQLLGGWFAAPDHEASNRFLIRYAEIFGQSAPRLSTLSYDAVALAATLVRQSKTPNYSAEQLTNENGFSGLDGIFRFSPDGLIERGLAIYEVGSNQFKLIDPAPKNFIDRDLPDPLSNPLLAIPQEVDLKAHSEAASRAQLPVNDGRPFPYNPVQKDAVNNQDQ